MIKIMLFIFFSSLCTGNKTRVSKHNFSVIKICSMCVYSHNTRTANIGTMSSKINSELAELVEANAYIICIRAYLYYTHFSNKQPYKSYIDILLTLEFRASNYIYSSMAFPSRNRSKFV